MKNEVSVELTNEEIGTDKEFSEQNFLLIEACDEKKIFKSNDQNSIGGRKKHFWAVIQF